jgi:hypothetical protein
MQAVEDLLVPMPLEDECGVTDVHIVAAATAMCA